MKVIIITTAFLITLTFTAEAKSYRGYKHYHQGNSHHYGRYLAQRHWRHLNRRYAHRLRHFTRPRTYYTSTTQAPCHRESASMGGPCGCTAAWKILHVADHVWRGYNLWLAWDWSRFPRAEPIPGTAAVWKNHSHVAAVKYATKDSIIVDDYWGVHPVPRSAVLIVDPHPPIKAGWRVAESWPL